MARSQKQQTQSPLFADSKYPRARLSEPTANGYLYLAAAVKPGRSPFIMPSGARSELIMQLKLLSRRLEQLDSVASVNVFRAVFRPHIERSSAYLRHRRGLLHVANFDVIVLIQTTSPEAALEVQQTEAYKTLFETARVNAKAVRSLAARNAKRIGTVDARRSRGLFLFNHFAADNPQVMLQLWEYLAGWYEMETGLENSMALVPMNADPPDYSMISCSRWDTTSARPYVSPMLKRSYRRYVTGNLEACRAAAMPIYCRLA